jgi:hypothetical protein
VSPVTNRYGVGAAKGFYEGAVWKQLSSPKRLAEIYVFAHHPRQDDRANHWDVTQWWFCVVKETDLPDVKSVSIQYLKWDWVRIELLASEVARIFVGLAPNGRTNDAMDVERIDADDGESETELR